MPFLAGDGTVYCHERPNNDLTNERHLHGRLVLQQFVGLQDQTGKDIYEGDIISYNEDEEILEVQYCEEFARFGGLIHKQDGKEIENDCWRWFDEPIAHDGKVVGNIFQNGYLLT